MKKRSKLKKFDVGVHVELKTRWVSASTTPRLIFPAGEVCTVEMLPDKHGVHFVKVLRTGNCIYVPGRDLIKMKTRKVAKAA